MKRVVLSMVGAMVLLAGAGGCKPKEVSALNSASDALFTVLADETAQAAGAKKQVIVIARSGPDGKPAEAAREAAAALKARQLSPEIKTVSLGDPMSYGSHGWSAASFFEVLQQNPEAGAVVSLVGIPLLGVPDIAKVPTPRPPLLVVAVTQLGLTPGVPAQTRAIKPLLDSKVIHLVIVDGTETPTETTEAHKLFGQSYMRLRSSR
jgi:hypothetical protein